MNGSIIRSKAPSPAEFRRARLAVGASQEQAAAAAGVTRVTVFNYESGRTARPHLGVVRSLSRVYRAFLKQADAQRAAIGAVA